MASLISERYRWEETWSEDHHQGQAVGGPEDSLQPDPQADQAHQGAAGQGDWSEHESDPGDDWRVEICLMMKGSRFSDVLCSSH